MDRLLIRTDNIENAKFLVDRQGGAKTLKTPKTWLFPNNALRTYERGMKEITDTYEEITFELLTPANINLVIDERNRTVPSATRVDDWSSDADRLIENIVTRVKTALPDNKKTLLVRTVGNQVNFFNEDQWRKVMKSAIGVDVLQREPFVNDTINSFITENLQLINKLEGDTFTDIQGILQRGVRDGFDQKQLTRQIKRKLKVTKRHAKFIANDQVGKLNGSLTMLRQTNLGIKRYKWKDSRDERVRKTHREHHNKIFRWNRPPSDTGHPGHDFNCRCIAEPVFADIIEELTLV